MARAAAGRAVAWSALTLLASCAVPPSPSERLARADGIAASRDWQRQVVDGKDFNLLAYLPRQPAHGGRLTIYIEGDGLAWITPSVPSSDPTPVTPVALQLALSQRHGAAAYLARPCQYLLTDAATRCVKAYWMERRFSAEVIAAMDAAVAALKARCRASRLVLVGYSGGGAVAALIAARRTDVEHLVTVAGNLDTDAWVRLHHLSPLTGSLNPADAAGQLRAIPQTHFSGELDAVVPTAVATAYAGRFDGARRPAITVIKGYDHSCCWAQGWPALWSGAAPD